MSERRYLDNTMLKDYKDCPRRYFLRHVKKWRREGVAPALVFGLSWHSAMDVLWANYGKVPDADLLALSAIAFESTWAEQGMPPLMSLEDVERLSPRTPMVAREMLAGEQPFPVPLPMSNSPDGRSTWYCGKLDKVFDYNSIRILGEHKSTTEYKVDGGFKSQYLQSWYIDSQILGYLYGGGLFFEGVEQVWVDAALVHKKVHTAFKFIPVSHQWSMLQQWIEDTSEWVRRVYSDEQVFNDSGTLGKGCFPKQTEACFNKYGQCQFLDICRTCPDPSSLVEPPLGFVEEEWSPFSVLKLHKLLETA